MLTCPVCKTLLPEGICFCARCKCEFVKHTFAPVFANDSRILILGTIPSPKSREVCFYYGHNGNRFWKIMSVLYNSAVETIADKTKLILDNRLALWDVLASCWIKGAKDDSIIQPEPNDFSRLLTLSKIERVLCTGTKAFCLYQKYCKDKTGIKAEKLPSTSPRNARFSQADLLNAYCAALNL